MSNSTVLVDWGTTSFRLWVVDVSGKVIKAHSSQSGLLALSPNEFHPYLDSQLQKLAIGDDVPILICGMAGSAQGWMEVSYVPVPTTLAHIAHQAKRVDGINRDVRIMPGLALLDLESPDVMRGEETQLIGAIDSQRATSENTNWFCLPGTHTKWVRTQGDEIQNFHTIMTGEVFSLLRQHSTLSPFLQTSEQADQVNSAFKEAIEQSMANPELTLQRLFSIRAKSLLFNAKDAQTMPDRLSGLLIGHEIAGILQQELTQITLVATGPLATRYKAALSIAGLLHKTIDAEVCVQQGLNKVAKQLWPERYSH